MIHVLTLPREDVYRGWVAWLPAPGETLGDDVLIRADFRVA